MQTIGEAFAYWTSIKAQLAGTGGDKLNRHSADMAQIERAAVLLPVQTRQDVFELLTMTTDDASEPIEATNAHFRRARDETNPKAGDTLAKVFAAWLAFEARLDGPTTPPSPRSALPSLKPVG